MTMSADIASVTIDKLRNEIARLKGQTNWVCSCGGTDCEGQKENADLHDTIDAIIEADERAVELWRAAHPGNELVIPDRAKLVGWLLDQNAALRKANEMVELERCEMMRSMSLAQNRSKQLRADKDRLDWLEKARPIAWALESVNCGEYWLLTDIGEKHPEEAKEFATLRAAIDAARKEAQP